MENNRVLVGMSGGVDSAAAALLLQNDGFEAVGCTLRLLRNEDLGLDRDSGCCSLADVEDARSVALRLGMDFFVSNFSADFRKYVMDDFVASYRSGRTPNPCIRCNRYIKFDALLQRADDLGIPYIATGHYARVEFDAALNRWQLLRGVDRQKDQSYFLYPLTQRQLSRLKLPVGAYSKSAIRDLAEQHGLVNARKKDSQDICFVPDGDYVAFLQRYGHVELQPGSFVDSDGNVLGHHRGQACYTTGQRRGLGISADRPLYVLRKDGPSNTVILGDDDQLFSSTVWAEDFNWLSIPPISAPLSVTAKTRYTQQEYTATLYPCQEDRVRVVFDQPQRAVTAGQALVVYDGDIVVGGGTICSFE